MSMSPFRKTENINMSKTLSFILFFSIGTLVVTSVHYYLWARMIKDTAMSSPFRNIGTYSLIIFAVSFPIALAVSRLVSFRYSYVLLWISYLWLGIMMLLFFSFLFTDLVKILFYISSKFSNTIDEMTNPERRKFISRSIASGISVMVFAATGLGVKKYYEAVVVKKIKILLTGLPEVFQGFKIVQISDLHIGQMMTGLMLEKIVDKVNSLKPDLIAITGDLVDGSINKLLNELVSLKNLKAEHGIYFVTGNHEYYSGVESWTSAIENMGIKVLNNESIMIKQDSDFFYLSGVTDHEAKNFGKKYAADFNKTFSGLQKDKKKILLAHQPIAVKEASEYETDLVLSGHTHGGQIWPFNYLVYLQQPYLKGSYQYRNTKLYVNQGTGCWGPPMRLGSFNEITEITLI